MRIVLFGPSIRIVFKDRNIPHTLASKYSSMYVVNIYALFYKYCGKMCSLIKLVTPLLSCIVADANPLMKEFLELAIATGLS